MGVSLERVQNKFACIIGELCSEPLILSQFAVWVDLRIAEYKTKGTISLDCSGDSPNPQWMKGVKNDPPRTGPTSLDTGQGSNHRRGSYAPSSAESTLYNDRVQPPELSPRHSQNSNSQHSFSTRLSPDVMVIKSEPGADQETSCALSRKRLSQGSDLQSDYYSPSKSRRLGNAPSTLSSAAQQESSSNQSLMSIINAENDNIVLESVDTSNADIFRSTVNASQNELDATPAFSSNTAYSPRQSAATSSGSSPSQSAWPTQYSSNQSAQGSSSQTGNGCLPLVELCSYEDSATQRIRADQNEQLRQMLQLDNSGQGLHATCRSRDAGNIQPLHENTPKTTDSLALLLNLNKQTRTKKVCQGITSCPKGDGNLCLCHTPPPTITDSPLPAQSLKGDNSSLRNTETLQKLLTKPRPTDNDSEVMPQELFQSFKQSLGQQGAAAQRNTPTLRSSEDIPTITLDTSSRLTKNVFPVKDSGVAPSQSNQGDSDRNATALSIALASSNTSACTGSLLDAFKRLQHGNAASLNSPPVGSNRDVIVIPTSTATASQSLQRIAATVTSGENLQRSCQGGSLTPEVEPGATQSSAVLLSSLQSNTVNSSSSPSLPQAGQGIQGISQVNLSPRFSVSPTPVGAVLGQVTVPVPQSTAAVTQTPNQTNPASQNSTSAVPVQEDTYSTFTLRNSVGSVRTFEQWLLNLPKPETRKIYQIPPPELDAHLVEFFQTVKKKNGDDYLPGSFSALRIGISHHLVQNGYQASIATSGQFIHSQRVFNKRKTELAELSSKAKQSS